MYVVNGFWVFVCSACAGIHRELNNKVKGISMSVFSEQELKDISENGNAVRLLLDLSLIESNRLFESSLIISILTLSS